MNKIRFPKRTVNICLILATLLAAVYYFSKHKSLLTDLKHVPVHIILIVLGLYIVMLLVLMMIFSATMSINKLKLKLRENGLLNIYSLFMNFFIPGQTGPVFRAYYLNKKHKLKVLDYTIATIIYYALYGVVSLSLLIIGSQKLWISLSLVALMVITLVVGLKIYLDKFKQERLNLRPRTLGYLLIATLSQALLQTVIYFVELHSIDHGVHLRQVIVYTGAANLALFVALTPGAIGIRESFLLLSERLHHISSANIVLANVIDRSVYIVFLLILGIVIVTFKAKERLTIARVDNKQQLK